MQDLDAVRGLVDQRAQYAAALTLARTIDQALPVLHAAAGPASADPVEGCDVLDALPALCIGSEAANTYTQDAVLLIDLGGDDLHRHGAGAASPLDGRPVSITLDLGGNDTYRAPGSSAHGIGSLGAVGILVDEAGDDAYIAQSTGDRASVTAQGNGVTGAVGILADRAGNDTYLVESEGVTTTFAAGQARASNAGVGLLLDSGDGEDTYTLRAAPERPFVDEDGLKLGGLNVNGQALTSIGGVAILADGGGPHAVTLEAIVPVIEATEEREVQQTPLILPAGMASGSIGGVSAALHGDGPATYTGRVTMQSTWTGIAGLNAIAQAGFRGAAMLSDADGDTVYRLDVRNTAARDATGQPGIAEATMGLPNWVVAQARGMGSASEAGTGLLIDGGGDDRYEVVVLSEAWARDDEQAIATPNPATSDAQGVGIGGVAVLDDRAGQDSYSVETRVAGTADAPTGTVRLSKASISAQGAAGGSGASPGQGTLLDRGGADTYTAKALVEGEILSGTGLITGANPSSNAQASIHSLGTALLHDRDAGESDSFTVEPADPACLGTRGEGVWVDCGPQFGNAVTIAGAAVGYVEDEVRP